MESQLKRWLNNKRCRGCRESFADAIIVLSCANSSTYTSAASLDAAALALAMVLAYDTGAIS